MVQTLILTKLDFFAPGRFTLIAPGNPRHALLGQKISSGPFDSVSIEWYKFYCLTPPVILPLTLTLTRQRGRLRKAAVEVCLLKQPMTRLLDATVTPRDRYPWRLLSASDSEGDSEGDC